MDRNISSPFDLIDRCFEMDKIIIFYDKQGFIYGPCKIEWDEKNKKKSFAKLPKWQNQTKSIKWNGESSLYIKTGKISNITVIDIDDELLCSELVEMCKEDCNLIVKTRK